MQRLVVCWSLLYQEFGFRFLFLITGQQRGIEGFFRCVWWFIWIVFRSLRFLYVGEVFLLKWFFFLKICVQRVKVGYFLSQFFSGGYFFLFCVLFWCFFRGVVLFWCWVVYFVGKERFLGQGYQVLVVFLLGFGIDQEKGLSFQGCFVK